MFELINKKTYKIVFIIAVIGTLIITFSVTPDIEVTQSINDKVAHGTIFFVLAFLCSHTMGRKFGVMALIGLALFGLLIEVIQYYIPWRDFSWLDWAADIAGIVLYDIIHRLKKSYYLKRR